MGCGLRWGGVGLAGCVGGEEGTGLEHFDIFTFEELEFFGGHFAGAEDAIFFAIGPEEREDAAVIDGFAEVEVSGFASSVAFGKQANAEGILERLFNFAGEDRFQFKRGIKPVEIHEVEMGKWGAGNGEGTRGLRE